MTAQEVMVLSYKHDFSMSILGEVHKFWHAASRIPLLRGVSGDSTHKHELAEPPENAIKTNLQFPGLLALYVGRFGVLFRYQGQINGYPTKMPISIVNNKKKR